MFILKNWHASFVLYFGVHTFLSYFLKSIIDKSLPEVSMTQAKVYTFPISVRLMRLDDKFYPSLPVRLAGDVFSN